MKRLPRAPIRLTSERMPTHRVGARALVRWTFLAALIVVLVLSLLPSSKLPPIDTGWDKSDHAVGFLVLALLGLAGWPQRLLAVTFGLLAYGALIELLQGQTGYRSAEWGDLIADGIGILLALPVALSIRLIASRCRRAVRDPPGR